MDAASPGYDLLVPVKEPGRAKTRLEVPARPALVRAMALDAVAAGVGCRAVRAVHLVSDDAELVAAASDLGAHSLPDLGEGDLNRALRRAAAALADRAGRAGPGPVAAMLGDLPCLLTDDLERALSESRVHGGGFVPDADGTGTTLLAGLAGIAPAFGVGSRAAHAAAGLLEVGLDAATLRRDVDTAADLDAARLLGVGPRTAAVLGAG